MLKADVIIIMLLCVYNKQWHMLKIIHVKNEPPSCKYFAAQLLLVCLQPAFVSCKRIIIAC